MIKFELPSFQPSTSTSTFSQLLPAVFSLAVGPPSAQRLPTMRLSFVSFFLSFLSLSTFVLAATPTYLTRRARNRSPAPVALTSRQFHVARDLIDVCINVKSDLLADAAQLLGLGSILGPLDLGANVQLCLCLKVRDAHMCSCH